MLMKIYFYVPLSHAEYKKPLFTNVIVKICAHLPVQL
jgi:hypothetical protein